MTVSLTSQNGFTGSVSISVEGLPEGVTSSPASLFSVAAGASQQVTFSASTSVSPGNAEVTFRGTSGALTHTVSTTLAVMQTPADPNASQKTRDVLNYLAGLPNRSDKRVISGQAFQNANFAMEWDSIFQTTGRSPGLMAGRYRSIEGSFYGPAETTAVVNARLINHWKSGGVVALDPHPANPKTGTRWSETNFSTAEMESLLTPGTALNATWIATLDQYAAGLQELQTDGVVVIFRPMSEMNADFAWYGRGVGRPTPAQYIRLWQLTFNYLAKGCCKPLANVKNLHNLLWVYAPYADIGFYRDSYPGDQYVDIVGLSYYLDVTNGVPIPKAGGYDELTLLAASKPFAFGEFGPLSGVATEFRQRDYYQLIAGIKQSMPKTVYWVSWTNVFVMGRESQTRLQQQHLNVKQLLEDPWVVNLGDITALP